MKPTYQWFALKIGLTTLLTCIVAGLQLFGQTNEQVDTMNTSLDHILHSVPFGNEATVQQVVSNLTSKYGRETASKIICKAVRDRALKVDELFAARLVGSSLQPEFSRAVFQALHDTGYSLAVGRLLTLLRDAPAEDAKSVGLWLSDGRPAEEFTRRGREVRGAAFRVCDVAYNVLQEIQATDISRIKVITHSESIAEREAVIAPLRQKYPQKTNLMHEATENTAFSTPKTVTDAQSNPVVADSNSLPLFRSNGWLSLASILVLVAVFAGWMLLRRRGGRKKQ